MHSRLLTFRRNFCANHVLTSWLWKTIFPVSRFSRWLPKIAPFSHLGSVSFELSYRSHHFLACVQQRKTWEKKIKFFQFHFLVSTNCLILRRIDGSSAIKFWLFPIIRLAVTERCPIPSFQLNSDHRVTDNTLMSSERLPRETKFSTVELLFLPSSSTRPWTRASFDCAAGKLKH